MDNVGILTDSKQFWQGIKGAADARNIDVTRLTVDQLATIPREDVPSVIMVDHLYFETEDMLEEFAIDFPETMMIIMAEKVLSSFLNSFAYLVMPRSINFSFIMDIVGNALSYQNLLLREDKDLTAVKPEKRADTLDYKRHKNLLIARNGELIIQRERLRSEKQRLENGLDELIASINTMIGYSNPVLRDHHRYVAKLSESLAAELNFGAEETRLLRRAALLHDIGLQEGGDGVEKRHPVTGEKLLAHVGGLCHLATIVRHHHERFDGKGHPDGLSGQEIPLPSRVIAIANHIARLTANGSMENLKEIVTSLSEKSGREFDPVLVKAMIHDLSRNRIKIKEDRMLIAPQLLKPGMRISEDLYTSHGLFLLPSGTLLDDRTISRIKSFHNIAPVPGGVEVYRDQHDIKEKAA